jgi:hypothetical protein
MSMVNRTALPCDRPIVNFAVIVSGALNRETTGQPPAGELAVRAIQTFALARAPTCQKKIL